MMQKFKIKKGDTVRVISGNQSGKEGVVAEILKNKNRVIVNGVNKVTKRIKPNASNPQGGLVEKEASLHISNLMLVEDGQTVRVGYRVENGQKIRFSKKTNKPI